MAGNVSSPPRSMVMSLAELFTLGRLMFCVAADMFIHHRLIILRSRVRAADIIGTLAASKYEVKGKAAVDRP
jgi:hypothetical protein